MEIYLVKISKTTLEKLAKDDRVLFLSFAHFANELRALQKSLVWSLPDSSLSDYENAGQVSLELMYLKLLAGKLNEAHQLIRQKLYGVPSGRELVAQLPSDATNALDQIKKYFSSGGIVNRIRNLDAFHYGTAGIDVALHDVPDEMEVYLQKVSVNTLYYFAEVLAIRAMLQEIGFSGDEFEKGLKQIQLEIINVAHWFTILSDGLLTTIVKKYGESIWDDVARQVPPKSLPAFDDVRIPWFVDAGSEIRDA